MAELLYFYFCVMAVSSINEREPGRERQSKYVHVHVCVREREGCETTETSLAETETEFRIQDLSKGPGATTP